VTCTTKNQFANMVEHRANGIQQIHDRIRKELADLPETTPAVLEMLNRALDALDNAQGLLRGGLTAADVDLRSPAQRAADAHQPGLPPGGGQPDLF
jgi:hypothetical protein